MYAEEASKEEALLMTQMKQVGETDALGGSQVGAIVGIGSSEIGSAAAAYQAELQAAQKDLDFSLQSGKLGQAAALARQKQHLISQKEDLVAQLAEIQVEIDSSADKMQHLQEERTKAAEYIVKLREQLDKLTALEGAASQSEELRMLKQLIMLNESLKSQEATFKASCKAQMQDFSARAEMLERTANDVQEEDKKLADIEAMHAQVYACSNTV
jgi:chorismate mutase